MPLGGKSKSPKTKLLWGPGQKDLFRGLYGEGGPLQALFGGGPDAGYEAGVNRGMSQLNQNLASQGIFGSPLGGAAASNYLAQAAMGREQNRMQTLLSASRPFGGGSSGGGGGGGILSMSGF
jgi:hypothetical protein